MKRNITRVVAGIFAVISLTACGNQPDLNSETPSITEQIAEVSTVSNETQIETQLSEEFLSTDATTATTATTETTAITQEITTDATTLITTEATTISSTIQTTVATTVQTEPVSTLDQKQVNSVSWLNYLALVSQEINSSKNSKMYLEEAYASLINNTNPENVNELTQGHLVSLLDIIENYRMIDTKRERLQYFYEQNKAKALKEAIPNPVALLSATNSLDPKRLIASVVYMAIDSYSSYNAYNNELDQAYLKDGWELDDEAAANLHDSRKRSFEYMLNIVREQHIPGELALNENAIEKFVECKNNTNVHQQIQFLESNKKTYKAFGRYWLLLAECYYNNKDYDKCLDCFKEYEALDSGIFRQDYELAKTMPIAIAAANEEMSGNEYIRTAEKYLETIFENTSEDDWALRYFAATMYVDLYAKTHREAYLKSSNKDAPCAYKLLVDNVTELSKKQNALNKTYLADVAEVSVPDGATKAEKKQIKAYNESLNDKRETELPEVYEPLAINCDLLFSVADKMNLSSSEKNHIEGILSDGNASVFLTKPIQRIFSFKKADSHPDASFDKDTLVLPVYCLSEGATVRATVTSGEGTTTYDDWKIKKVDRNGDDVLSFKATFTSKKVDDCKWRKDSVVKFEIFNGEYSNSDPLVVTFKVSKFKEHRVKGVGWDTVEFEQVM